MVSAAKAERTPPAHMTTTWADLSGIRPSIEDSRLPLGRCTEPASAPCSYSSGSRTSRTIVPAMAISSSASAVVISRTAALALASISLKVGTAVSSPRCVGGSGGRSPGPKAASWTALHRSKHYQRGRHSLRAGNTRLKTRRDASSTGSGRALRWGLRQLHRAPSAVLDLPCCRTDGRLHVWLSRPLDLCPPRCLAA